MGKEGEGPRLKIGPVEAVEALASEYGDSVEDIIRWPPRRFNAFYQAMVRRHAIRSMEDQRSRIVAALYSNPNWDQKEANRGQTIKEISEQFNIAMELVYDSKADKRREAEIDWDNPFWQAAKRAQDRLRQRFGLAESTQEEREQVVSMSEEQIDARQKSRKEIDQL